MSQAKLLGFVLMALILLTSGCQQAQKPYSTPNANPNATPAHPIQVTESDKRIMANRFSELAKTVPGVVNATVVVAGADAAAKGTSTNATKEISTSSPGKIVVMVGITLNTEVMASATQQASTKKMVKQKILDSDKRVTDVLVTSDANMVKKINDVAAGLIEGKPVLSYARSAAELGKMMKEQVK
ncbi:MAG TPA: YhcN/YlaJ family sporulation lipoprotein [Syntrophomonas sp.]|nr:YhcN/YlaJ family sporulation lipoprotein [Syntrophomonas sp.]HRW12822.1 YhcN/YlaJ family sporulation lipoprotein [Syntrophomonas sp.]